MLLLIFWTIILHITMVGREAEMNTDQIGLDIQQESSRLSILQSSAVTIGQRGWWCRTMYGIRL